MARRSARIASSQSQPDSSPSNSQSSPAATGTKRKAAPGSSPTAKRGKKDEKEQKTIEESMDVDEKESEQPKTEKAEPEEQAEPSTTDSAEQTEDRPDTSTEKQDEPAKDDQANGHEEEQHVEEPKEESKPEAKEETEQPKEAQDAQSEAKKEPKEQETVTNDEHHDAATNGDDAVEPNARDAEVPSSILEKGIMYFFYRGRVNVDDPKSVDDLQRSYLVLRPLPHGAKLSDGPIGDDKNCRLIAIPKKMLPLSGKDRWIAFTETVNTSFSELRESFLKSDDYNTQTGPRHTPAASPAAEGVYAITSTGRESHLAYIITLPEELGSVQNDLGLRPKGSFVVSVKNPKAGGPANTNIGKDPGYSQELMNEFRSLRWMGLKPDHLNYEGCQFLMIGEGEQGLDKATEPQDGDEKKDERPREEMEKLEGEDEIRVEHLNGEDAVFADLGTNAKDYPKLQTMW